MSSYTYKDVLTRASTTIQVIDDTTLYKATIFSSNGNIFNINDTTSQLTVVVQKGLDDITDQFTDIVWSRFSYDAGKYEEDLKWGEQHKGKKTFVLHRDDILEKANIQVAIYMENKGQRTLVAADYVSFIDMNDMKGSATPPPNPVHGDVWINTSVTPPKLMMWDDQKKEWVELTVAGNEKRNLLRNSNFYKKTLDHWTTVGSPTITIESLSDKKWARIKCSNATTYSENGLSQIVDAKAGSTYAFQLLGNIYANSAYPSGKARVVINSINSNKVKTLLKEQILDITTTAKNHNFIFTAFNDTVQLEVIVTNVKNQQCDFIFTNSKLERNVIATAWEIAIEDIQDALDNKLGNTADEVYNSLTDNGSIQGLYKDNNKFYFNGEYINAKNLTVTNTAGAKTLAIDSNGNVSIRATSLSIGAHNVATDESVQETVKDTVKSIQVLYRLSDSPTSLQGNYEWSTIAPEWKDGKYMWMKTVTTYVGDKAPTTDGPTCISGATGPQGPQGNQGTSPVIGILSNENHTIPTDVGGNNGNYAGATTTMYIYNGSKDDSANWTVSATAKNVTGSLSGKTYTVTGMSADTGYVDLTASRSGYTSVTKRFTLAKAKQGSSPIVYKLGCTVAAISKSTDNVYTPKTIGFTANQIIGTVTSSTMYDAYEGIFVISETTDGTSYTTKYTSTRGEASKTYTPSAGIKAINVKLYMDIDKATLLDEQTIPIVSDGQKGDKGDAGTPAKYVIVNGEQVFKYAENFAGVPTPSTITLSATLTGTTGYQWSYRVPGSTTSTNISGATSSTYAVAYNNSIWGTHKQITFRCTSGGVYDEITLVKVSDGAKGNTGDKGNDAYTVILTNESHTFPGGTSAAIAGSTKCEVIAYKGTTRVAATIGTISGLPTGMTAPITSNGTTSAYFSPTVTTSMATKGGVLTIPITVDGKSFTKNFTYSLALKGDKGDQGNAGTPAKYVIVNGEQVFKFSNNFSGAPTPSTITLSATLVGTTGYQWSYRTPGSTTINNISGATSSTYAVAYNNSIWSTHKQLTFRCTSGGVYDEITLTKVTDGAKGDTGGTGNDAYTVILSNESHTFPGGTSAAIAGSTKCEVIAYKGAARIAATIGTISGLPTGMTAPVTNNGTTSAYFSPTVTTSMTTKGGILTIPITVDGKSFTKNFTYSLALKGDSGGKGDKGDTGASGRSILSITPLYKKSTSKNQQTTPTTSTESSWSTTPLAWQEGYYIHSCYKITYDKAPTIEYTTPSCDNSWEAVNNINTQEAIFKKLFGDGTQGFELVNGKVYINGEIIKASAITSTILEGKTIKGGTISGGTITGATLSGGKLTVGSNFSVNNSGILTAKGANITGTINATSGNFSGNITSSAIIEGGTIKGARVESSYHIRGDYPPDPPAADGPVGYSTVKHLLSEDHKERAMNDVNDYSYSVSLSGANLKSSVYQTYMGDPSMGYHYDTLDIWGSNLTMVSGYSPGNAQDNVLVLSPSTIKMQSSEGSYPININSYRGLAGDSAVEMEMGLTVHNDLILNNYLTINAWAGYGSGKAEIWYDGTKKALTIRNPVEDILVNNKYVYREGRYPGRLWVEGTNTTGSPSNDTTAFWGAKNNSIHFFSSTGCLKHQPNQWGYLMNFGQGNEVHQIWMTQADGDMLHRGGNGNGWHGSTTGAGTWKTILDSSNFTNYAISKNASCNKNWHWSGQSGQPTWVWGGFDGTNMYVYNPANFSVSWSTGAGYSNEWRSTSHGTSYLTTGNGDNATWTVHNTILRTHWGLGVRDYTDTCRFLIDARTGNTFSKGYFMGTAFHTSSDRRLKENIAPIDIRLEKLFMELRPVNYCMVNQEDKRMHNGFIAQEVEEAMLNNNISYEEFAGLLKRKHGLQDEKVNEQDIPMQILNDTNDEDNIEYSLNYNEFTALNTHMIQKCLKKIEELEQQIKELKNL